MADVSVKLDDKSVQILKGVDTIHRDSIINVGLALVAKTGYYKTLTGKTEPDADLDDVASLDIEDEGESSAPKKASKKTTAAPAAKPTSSWDSF